jgi:tetratricopeptide (TPR) repeat protein
MTTMSLSKPPTVFHWLCQFEFQKGVDFFESLKQPTPDDECWAGLCYLAVGKLLEAQAVLMHARGQGNELAGVNLATTYRHLGDLKQCQKALESVNKLQLDGFAKAMWQREWGQYYFASGLPKQALEATERAWAFASSAQIGEVLLPGIAVGLGMAFQEMGCDQRAIGYLRHAAKSVAPERQPYLLGILSVSLRVTGQFQAAQMALEQGLSSSPTLAVLHYFLGSLEKAKGNYKNAIQHLITTATNAKELLEHETECFAHIELLSIATADNNFKIAEEHCARATFLANTERLKAFVSWRTGELEIRKGSFDGLQKLFDAQKFFNQSDAKREIALVWLHIAEAHLRLEEKQQSHMALTQALEIRHAISNGAFLAAELRALPYLFNLLTQTPDHLLLEEYRRLTGAMPIQFEIRTIGTLGIFVDGTPVKLKSGIEKTIETLAYLLKYQTRNLEQILTDVFNTQDPKQARNYFHMLRNAVKTAIPGLEIHHSKHGDYTIVHPGLLLKYDLHDLKRSLSAKSNTGLQQALALYRGTYLPHVSSEWAEKERNDVEWSVVRAGLEVIETYYKQGEYSKCLELAERLLEIAPSDVTINDLVIRATFSLSGAVATRQEFVRVNARFQREIGEIPEEIMRLQRELPGLN